MPVATRLWQCSAAQLAGLVRRGELSPVEIVDAHLERIAEVNPELNAIVTLRADEARRDAAAAPPGPLCGVPFTVKDTIATAGVRTTCGSPALAEFVPAVDATAVDRLKRAGAILLGKTNCPELGLGVHTDNALFGATRNPLGPFTPGGSSGGEAAAIASGCSALGLGTDFGGSLRWPAACTGIASLRPTIGRVPGTGAHLPAHDGAEPALPDSLSLQGRLQVVGPLARTVEDLELALTAIAGPDGLDPAAVPAAVEPGAGGVAYWDDDGAVADAGRALAARPLGSPVLAEAAELYTRLRERASAGELSALWAARDRLRARALELFAHDRALLAPVATEPPFPVPADDALTRWEILDPCRAISLLGLPAVSVPWARTAEGLPVSIQVVAAPFHETDALAVARELERLAA